MIIHKNLNDIVPFILWASLVAQLVKNLPAMLETLVGSLGWKIPWKKEWLPTPVFLPGEFHGQRSLAGYSPWVCKESDTIEQLILSLFHRFWYVLFPFSLVSGIISLMTSSLTHWLFTGVLLLSTHM